jgi:hypothetical protein
MHRVIGTPPAFQVIRLELPILCKGYFGRTDEECR